MSRVREPQYVTCCSTFKSSSSRRRRSSSKPCSASRRCFSRRRQRCASFRVTSRAPGMSAPPENRGDVGPRGPRLGLAPQVGEEPVVFQDLPADAVQFLPQRHSPSLELPQTVPNSFSALPPLPLFFQGEQHAGGVHGGVPTPDGPDYLIVMSALYSAFTCAVGRTVLSRSKRFIAWLTTSRAIPSVASSPKTSSRLSIFHTLTKFATVRCVAASLTRTLPMRFSPSRVVDRERT